MNNTMKAPHALALGALATALTLTLTGCIGHITPPAPYASSTTGTSQAQGDLLGWTQDTLNPLTKTGWTITDTRDINHRVPEMPGTFIATSPDGNCTAAAFLSPYATEFPDLPDKALSKDFANQYLTSLTATNETPTDAKPFTPIKATYSQTPLDAVAVHYSYPAAYSSADLIPTPSSSQAPSNTPTQGTMHASSIFIASPANGNSIDPSHLTSTATQQLKNTTLIPVYQLTYRCLNETPNTDTWKQLLTSAQTTMTSDPALLPNKNNQTLAPQ